MGKELVFGPQILRNITQDEVDHFRANGWVKLKGLYSPESVQGLLARARERMGEDPLTVSRSDPSCRVENEYAWYSRWDGCSHVDPWINKLSHSRELASIAAKLMGISTIRFYFDHMFVKRSAQSGGSATPWHQDLPHHPLDRQQALTIWSPLVKCTPDMGSLRFLNGSHQAGLLGRYLNRDDGISLVDENKWVLEKYEISPPIELDAGDATVHNLSVIHYASRNKTPHPRWVYVTQWMSPLTRYTGAPNHRTDGCGLHIDRPLDHPRFPIIVP